MSDIIVVRHGQASFYSSDYDQLSDLGKQQISQLADQLISTDSKPTKIIVGDLNRQIQSAKILQEKLGLTDGDLSIDHRLREHKAPQIVTDFLPKYKASHPWIAYNHDLYLTDRKKYLSLYLEVYDFIAHEWASGAINSPLQSWADYVTSVRKGLKSIYQEHQHDRLLVVTSTGPAAIALGDLHDLSPAKAMRLACQIRNASATYIDRTRQGLALRHFNDVSHLDINQRTIV